MKKREFLNLNEKIVWFLRLLSDYARASHIFKTNIFNIQK